MPQIDYAPHVAKSIMMSRYNQPYSEIKDIPYSDLLFFLRLVEAEDQYTKNEMDKQKAETNKMKNKMRRR